MVICFPTCTHFVDTRQTVRMIPFESIYRKETWPRVPKMVKTPSF